MSSKSQRSFSSNIPLYFAAHRASMYNVSSSLNCDWPCLFSSRLINAVKFSAHGIFCLMLSLRVGLADINEPDSTKQSLCKIIQTKQKSRLSLLRLSTVASQYIVSLTQSVQSCLLDGFSRVENRSVSGAPCNAFSPLPM